MRWIEKPEEIVVQEIDDELVLLNLSTEKYFSLNATARRFWEVCLACASFDEAVVKLAGEYGVESSLVERDLRRLLDELSARGTVSIRGRAGYGASATRSELR